MDAERKTRIKKIIIDGLYLIILIVTLVAAALDLVSSMVYLEAHDDIFGSAFVPFFTGVFLTPVLIAEFDVFFTIRYFLLHWKEKNRLGIISNSVSCMVTIFIMILFVYSLLEDSRFIVVAVIWALCYPIFRIIYYAVYEHRRQKDLMRQ